MKVFIYGEEIIDTEICFNCINHINIIFDEEMTLLPYENSDFLSSIKMLIEDIVDMRRPPWKKPDYAKSRCYFYISGVQVDLMVEVFPKQYSAKEKRQMLASASREAREDGYSDYCEFCDMFDAIDEAMNSPYPTGEVAFYQLEMGASESERLFSLLK